MSLFKKLLFVPVIVGSFSANASLHLRGGGTMLYDSDYDVTWLADANYAKTSGYDATGAMTWSESVSWADQLAFGGFSDWRLPSALNQDGSGAQDPGGDSELYHLTQLLWGDQVGGALSSNPSENYDLFQNIQDTMYWSSTYSSDPQNPNSAWMTTFVCCAGYIYLQQDQMASSYGWAVRTGDVAPVPLPAAFWLFVSGFAGLLTYSRRHYKTRIYWHV